MKKILAGEGSEQVDGAESDIASLNSSIKNALSNPFELRIFVFYSSPLVDASMNKTQK